MQEQSFFHWEHVARNQLGATLKRAGLLNFATQFVFVPLWLVFCYSTLIHLGVAWLLLPAFCNLLFAIAFFQRYRLMLDTPASFINYGAQGYVVLRGKAYLPSNEISRGISSLPVTLWLPGYIEDQPFILDDGHGQCLLYPDAAEVITRPADTHLDWLKAIYPGQELYVLGEMRTLKADNGYQILRYRVSELLARWKTKPHILLEAYDTNGDGQLDEDEWAKVFNNATRIAQEDLTDNQIMTDSHVIDSSSDGRLFMITNIPPAELAHRYRRAMWLHNSAWLGLLAIVYSSAL